MGTVFGTYVLMPVREILHMKSKASGKMKKGGGAKYAILPVMIAALLAVVVFASLPNADSNGASAAVGVAGDYNQGDIDAINGMIDNNNLGWPKAPDDGATADAAWMASNWPGVTWSATPDARITYLNLNSKALTGTLNMSGLASMEGLECHSNTLTALNMSGLTAMTFLDCSGNLLTSLNVSGCTALQQLYCEENDLTSLNVAGCDALLKIEARGNLFASLDLSGMPSLEYVKLEGNYRLSSINVSGCAMLNYLYLGHCDLRTATFTDLPELGELYLQQNKMTSVTLTDLPKLWHLELQSNNFVSMTLTGLPALRELEIGNNFLTHLNVRGLTALESLYCEGNLLPSLDVSGLTSLTSLNCQHNMIASLDVTGCVALHEINCPLNELTALDLTTCTAMASGALYIGENLIANVGTDIIGAVGLIGSTPQRVKVELTILKSVDDLQAEIQGILDAGKVPYLVGHKMNADKKLTLTMASGGKISLAGTYGGNALELKGYGEFWVERTGTLTVTALDLEITKFIVKGTATVNGDVNGNAGGTYVHIRNRGTLHVKGNMLFTGINSQVDCENGTFTVDGNITFLLGYVSNTLFVFQGGTATVGGNVTAPSNAVGTSGGWGSLTIKGSVVCDGGDYAVYVQSRNNVVVEGNVTYNGTGAALKLDNRGSLLVKGNVVSDSNGIIIDKRAAVKINGTIAVGDTAWFINTKAESDFTPVSSGGYDKVFTVVGQKWSVSVGKQPEPPGGGGGSNTLLIVVIAAVAVAAIAGAVYFFFLRPKP